MSDETLGQQLAALRRLLTEVDERLGRTPAPPAGLEDLKRGVDSLRTNIWATLSAGQGPAAEARIERFKLRRGIDTLRALLAGLDAGGGRHPEHGELQLLARELADRIGRLG